MELVSPSVEYKESFIAAVKEFQQDDDYTHRTLAYKELSIPELEADFDSFVERERSHSRGENLQPGHVPCTEYWLVEGDEYIGRVSIRHRLNEQLMQIGGHIGYDIRPTRRGQGYGNEMLRLTLQKAKGLGIQRALITTDIRNVASRKLIEKNGGILENQIQNPEMGHDALRYWIDIH